MKKLDMASFHRSVTAYILLSMLVLALATALSTLFFQKYLQEQKQQEYNRQIHSSIEHVTAHHLHSYSYILRRIIQTTDLPILLKQKNREGLHTLLKGKWDSLREQEPCLTIMHIHSSDGTSFLRMHKPETFDDNLTHLRPMIKEIHSLHKPVNGYETGKYSNVYRIIYPVFDENREYIGAVELGLNPNFIIKVVHDINKFEGLLFIEDESLKLYSTHSDIIVDGYRLQSKLTPRLRPFAMKLDENGHLEDHIKISVKEKNYFTHLYTINDFHNNPKVKIVFFQNISDEPSLNNYFLVGIFIFIGLVLLLLTWLIHRRIALYNEDISQIYKEQIEELDDKKRYLKTIFDVNPNIMITTDGFEIDRANPAMLEFLGFNTFESFKQKHNCICDYFLKEQNALQAVMGELSWIEYILQKSDELHKAYMLKDGKIHHFIVWAELLKFDEKNRAVAMFMDITELDEVRERLEYAVNGTNDGLWDWNIKTDELYLSPRFKSMLGYSDDELPNKIQSLIQLVHPDDLQETKKSMDISKKSSEVHYEVIYRLQHKDGHWVWILSRAQTIFNQDKKAIRMVGFHTDISNIKNLEQELQNKDEMMIAQSRNAAMGEMISMIAHQWRQPITTIAMEANNILTDIELESLDEASLKEGSKNIIHQTQELSKTIDDFRNFFKQDKEKEEVLVTDIFMESYAIINKSLQNNNIETENIFDSNTKISLYSRELLQVFINLLKNAKEALVEHRESGRKITNKIYETETAIIIEISDNGGGIEDALFYKLFQQYFTTKGAENGTGLGLYMSKTIIEKHLGGKISVENTKDESGARVGLSFTIQLPKKEQ